MHVNLNNSCLSWTELDGDFAVTACAPWEFVVRSAVGRWRLLHCKPKHDEPWSMLRF